MKKQIIAILLVTALALCGCAAATEAIDKVTTAAGDAIGQLLSGDVTGEVGKVYRTEWFNFTIESVKPVAEYAGHKPADGYVFYDVKVVETNTFDRAIPMGTFDFFMDQEDFEDYVYPIDPLDDTMMPLEFELAKGEFAEYHMVFEIPAGTEGLILQYIEWDEEDTKGATFTIHVN